MWNCSSPINLVKLQEEKDNYSYKDAELWKMEKIGACGKCIVEFIRNTYSNESAILSMRFLLRKSYINEWFGTSY